MKAHCLFEQSGTFKNEFKKLGIEAFDYDILNDYGQTDFQIDLFAEIEKAYKGGQSIFDDFTKEDIILAFFPCVRFEDQIMVHMRGQCNTQVSWTDEQKLEYSMKLQNELSENYNLISKMVIVCLRKELRLMIENPYSPQHYLKQYWSLSPKIIDRDRTANGDWMKKPTQYYFVNFDPKQNILFESLEYVPRQVFKKITNDNGKKRKERRSEIHSQYANRFIRKYLIDYEQDFSKLYEEGSEEDERAIHEKDIESLKHRLAAIQEMGGDSN